MFRQTINNILRKFSSGGGQLFFQRYDSTVSDNTLKHRSWHSKHHIEYLKRFFSEEIIKRRLFTFLLCTPLVYAATNNKCEDKDVRDANREPSSKCGDKTPQTLLSVRFKQSKFCQTGNISSNDKTDCSKISSIIPPDKDSAIVNSMGKETAGSAKGKAQCEEDTSCHKMCIRNYCQSCVDIVTVILTETVVKYADSNIEYRNIVNKVWKKMLDANISYLEDPRNWKTNVELIECKLMMSIGHLDEMKKQIAHVEGFIKSVEKLVHATSETSCLAGAEYPSLALIERLKSALAEMKRIKAETMKKEQEMMQLQSVLMIERGRNLM